MSGGFTYSIGELLANVSDKTLGVCWVDSFRRELLSDLTQGAVDGLGKLWSNILSGCEVCGELGTGPSPIIE